MIEPAASIAATIDPPTLALVDRLARGRGITGATFAAEAIRRVVESETDLEAFVQQGRDAIARGDYLTQDELLSEVDGMIDRHRARCG